MTNPQPSQVEQQVQRILESKTFCNSHTLSQLLRFIVAKAQAPDAERLKEYTVGVEAFGRPQDFDPKIDPIVRVQTHRLRQKLKEYYESDGQNDPIRIEIPKGSYLPVFENVPPRGHAADRHPLPEIAEGGSIGHPAGVPGEAADAPQPGSKPGSLRRLASLRNAAILCVSIAIFLIGLFVGGRWPPSGARNANSRFNPSLRFNSTTDPVKAFWTDLIGHDPTPIIGCSDAVFLLDSHNDLFWFPHGSSEFRGAPVDPALAQKFAANPALVSKAGQLYYENGYTGTGDLIAVATLANLFGRMGLQPIIEPSSELTPADFERHNVILIGASFQSFTESLFNTLGDFTFENPNPLQGNWSGVIVNSNPRPGEKTVYRTERDPVTKVLTTDHALITVQPGITPGRYILNFGGLDTMGTEGAVMFATSKPGVQELLKALDAQNIHGVDGGLPLFQGLLSVRLEKGKEVLGASLLTVHPLTPTRKAASSLNEPNLHPKFSPSK